MKLNFRGYIWILIFSQLLSACGGGGGGGGSQQNPGKIEVEKPVPPVEPPKPPDVPQPPVTPEPQELLGGRVDKEVQAYMAYEVGGVAGVYVDTSTNVDLKVVPNGSVVGSLEILGGNFPWHGLDIPFYPGVVALGRVSKLVYGFQVDQYLYNSGVFRCSIGNCVQTISMQTLSESGYGSSGIGSWKYVSPKGNGGYMLQRVGLGSFVFGEPTPSEKVRVLSSAKYSGYLQGNPEYYWAADSAYFQLTGVVGVEYSNATDTLNISLGDFRYWRGYMGLAPANLVSDEIVGPGNYMTDKTITCLAYRISATDLYGCDIAVPGLQGKLKGKFYGGKGREFSGTFTLRGLVYGSSFQEGAVGAFLSKVNN